MQARRNSLTTPPKREHKKAPKSASHTSTAAASNEVLASQKESSQKPCTALADAQKHSEAPRARADHKSTAALEASASTNADERLATAQLSSTTNSLTIFTIGHSTHPIGEFIALLKNYGIEQLVDVRTVPKSRHVPQFNSEALAESLCKQRISYVHLKALGGLRHAKKDSINTGWRNASFRGYADYMATEEFAKGIDRLIELAKAERTVIMCAEAVPWRCHRSLIGDALLVRGLVAEDIMTATSIRPHKLTEFAKVDGQQITYPTDKNLELFNEHAVQSR
jgi:Protein of unknown function, DUF488